MNKLKMSFYDGTLNRDKLIDFIKETTKPIKYTIGFKYKNPTTCEKQISKEEAIKIIRSDAWIDATEREDFLDLQTYTSNDMF